MGISKVVAVNSTVLCGVAYTLRNRIPPLALLPVLYSSVVGFLVATASHPAINHAHLFCKRQDGGFPWWSRLLFYPYMISAKGYVYFRRKMTTEPVYSKICEGIYVGGWPFIAEDVPPGEPAIVDCTCELPRSACVEDLPYCCIPTWDSRGPLAEDVNQALEWALARRKDHRPVFIHCAFGHGRSVAVTCALLIALGKAQSWEEAQRLIKSIRPAARLNSLQIQSVENWRKLQ